MCKYTKKIRIYKFFFVKMCKKFGITMEKEEKMRILQSVYTEILRTGRVRNKKEFATLG